MANEKITKIIDESGKTYFIDLRRMSAVADSYCEYHGGDGELKRGVDVYVGNGMLTIDVTMKEFLSMTGWLKES